MKGNALDRLMAPVADCLDEASLRALVDLRADTAQSDRIQELAERCNEGQLSDGERAEYETMKAYHQRNYTSGRLMAMEFLAKAAKPPAWPDSVKLPRRLEPIAQEVAQSFVRQPPA